MSTFQSFLKRKNIVISGKRYGIDALGAMAQGLFCSLLVGTIINTLGTQFHIAALSRTIATIAGIDYTVGGMAMAMSGPAMACAIGYALSAPPLVLFSLITVGFASNALGGAGGPLAVLFVAIIAAECGKAVSKETKVDILVTPVVTIGIGVALSWAIAPLLGSAAMQLGSIIVWATELQPFFMGIIVSVVVGIALTLPISSAAICAADGRFCGCLLQGKRGRRPCISGNRHLYAPDGQYCQKSPDLDRSDSRLRNHGSDCHLHLSAEDGRTGYFQRDGNLWPGGPSGSLFRLDQ